LLFARVDRSLIGLVVDEEKRARLRIAPRRQDLADPIVQIFEDASVLLDDQKHRPLLHADPQIVRERAIEIPVRGLGGEVLGVDAAIELADTDSREAGAATCGSRIVAKKVAIHATLRLLPERVVHAGKYDYQLIPCVCRLARQSRVVGGLSELDMPDDEPTTIPGAVTVRVFHLLHNQISRKVDRIDCRRRPALILEQEIAVALEESAAFLSISKIPGNVASLINEFRWPTNLDD